MAAILQVYFGKTKKQEWEIAHVFLWEEIVHYNNRKKSFSGNTSSLYQRKNNENRRNKIKVLQTIPAQIIKNEIQKSKGFSAEPNRS